MDFLRSGLLFWTGSGFGAAPNKPDENRSFDEKVAAAAGAGAGAGVGVLLRDSSSEGVCCTGCAGCAGCAGATVWADWATAGALASGSLGAPHLDQKPVIVLVAHLRNLLGTPQNRNVAELVANNHRVVVQLQHPGHVPLNRVVDKVHKNVFQRFEHGKPHAIAHVGHHHAESLCFQVDDLETVESCARPFDQLFESNVVQDQLVLASSKQSSLKRSQRTNNVVCFRPLEQLQRSVRGNLVQTDERAVVVPRRQLQTLCRRNSKERLALLTVKVDPTRAQHRFVGHLHRLQNSFLCHRNSLDTACPLALDPVVAKLLVLLRLVFVNMALGVHIVLQNVHDPVLVGAVTKMSWGVPQTDILYQCVVLQLINGQDDQVVPVNGQNTVFWDILTLQRTNVFENRFGQRSDFKLGRPRVSQIGSRRQDTNSVLSCHFQLGQLHSTGTGVLVSWV
ncbi:hypothetical protein OGAPHI_006667 [Ogataea philodendri]|uniref:Uncharacterized protein n=1 Tax=Ogataea philodendri TaxID=1378263 RepID=A0A9P8NWX4_9ASCO|nr:uncharacterized protein OGAPHI_006667 [Ogataea philodendri]KAH3661260.1 hypothetical protein OGAPHI_006667 [Ogataea philodendri]